MQDGVQLIAVEVKLEKSGISVSYLKYYNNHGQLSDTFTTTGTSFSSTLKKGLWRPLTFNYLLEKHGLYNFRVLGLLLGWLLLLTICLGLTIHYVPSKQYLANAGKMQISYLLAFYPPLIVSILTLFWFGFEWGFIPAYLSTFIIGLASGLSWYWALLLSLAVVMELAIYGLVYYSVPIPYDMRSISSITFFVGTSLVAAISGSLGSFVWSLSHNYSISQTLILWKGWWTGTFLQAILIIGPILFLTGNRMEQFKANFFDIPERPGLFRTWIYASIISIVTILCIMIGTIDVLSSLHIKHALYPLSDVSSSKILTASESFRLTTWISILLVLVAGLAGIHLVGTWNDILERQIRERTRQYEKSEEKLRKEKEFTNSIINSLPGIFYLIERGGTLKRWNQNLKNITGYSNNQLANINPSTLFITEEQDRIDRKIEQAFNTGGISTETYLSSRNGEDHPYLLTGIPFKVQNKKYLMGMGIDITRRKRYEEQIEQSLKEKKALLAEIHHRVKNNLALISGLFELQMQNAESQIAENELQISQSRIHSIALVHEKAYQLEEYASVNLEDYINSLTEHLISAYGYQSPEQPVLNTEPINLIINRGVPFGLLMSEMLNNAFKNTLAQNKNLDLTINVWLENHTVHVQLEDKGNGLPSKEEIDSPRTLSKMLINKLLSQLKASSQTHNSPQYGSQFRFSFEKETV